MDPLREDDLRTARETPPEEKLRQAFEMFAVGLELKRAGLRIRHPQATEQEIEAMVDAWLISED